jgi:nitroimidazol reductase NimA-like FMN-containing flavoprotein (pyridoxamine 5'-phosphate oxidase superfamily)
MLGKLSSSEIEHVLSHNLFGRIGCYDAGRIYVVPVNYVYDGKDIIAHSVEGMKIQMMRNNPEVCFEVDEVRDFTNWKSVIVLGEYQEIVDEMERYRAIKFFVDRTLRIKISETAIPPETSEKRVHPRSPGMIKPVIYRIVALEKSGRYEKD